MKSQFIKAKKNSGFTIIELLIVIIVIGILAAIGLVMYTGVTASAKTSAGTASVANTTKAMNAYFSEKNNIPASEAALTATITSSSTVGLPNNTKFNYSATVPTAAATDSLSAGGNAAYIQPCGTTTGTGTTATVTGAKVYYWDFKNNALSTATIVGSGC